VRLTVETGPLAGTILQLDRDHPTTLGSAPECGLRVPDAGVLPQHAVVKALKDQGFGIKALGPGVRVNGAAVEAAPLQDGDVIELGTTRVAFGHAHKRGLPQLSGYRILGELGRGGMGMVYRAEQVSLHREVALKVLNHELTEDPQFVARFVAEARAAAKLQHPNVVQVFDVDHDGGTYYYAMELMQQGSLEDWLKQNGAMPADRALRVIADAAAGLAYAESLGIVHRDIKPDNLMLDQHGAAKIADLGLAGTADETDDKAFGTPHFMAPEQVLQKDVDHRTDLYALGCTFYRLVTGRTPFKGQSKKDILRAQVKDEPEPANRANPAVPAEVAAIIQRLMAKEPAGRFQTANELIEQLDLLLQPPAKKGLWVGLAAAGVLVAGGAIYWALTREKETQYIEVEKKYDDPEKQQFADEIKLLKRSSREDQATIALLTARLSGLPDAELAPALERVAAAHADTRAGAEAAERAAALRASTAERERRLQQRRAAIDEFLAGLAKAMRPPLQARNFALAWQALAADPPAALRDDPELAAGLQRLRGEVTEAGTAHLQAFGQRIAAARGARDPSALEAAVGALADALADPAHWPEALRGKVDAGRQLLAEARADLAALQRAQRDSAWEQYRAVFLAERGVAAALHAHDFAAAAAAAAAFARDCAGEPASAHAAAFAAAAERAEAFQVALERAAAAGQLVHRTADGAPLTVLRWDRKARQLAVADPAKKPPKEQPLSLDGFAVEAIAALAEQISPPAPGARECFVGLLALDRHADAARAYLLRLQAGDDASGTSGDAYPLGTNLFDQLLRRLPEDDQQAWCASLRGELRAGQRLAAGLRALSERRNLAAAGHLERLLADHPHSAVVLVLR